MGKNLKQALFLLCLAFLAAVPANFAFAQGVTQGDLGVPETGILPSNPFYFFKTWSRSIRQTFSFSDLSRAELQLNIVNEQAAEIRKLEEINPDRFSAFSRAVASLNESISLLKTRVLALKGATGIEKFVAVLLDKALKFQDILDGLTTKFKDSADASQFYAAVAASSDKLASLGAYLPGNIIDMNKFAEIFEVAALKQRGELREFRAAEFIDHAGVFVAPVFRNDFLKLKDSLLLQWGGRLQALEQTPVGLIEIGITTAAAPAASSGNLASILGLLENTPGSILRRIKVLDEVREKILDQDLKNQINIIRQRILDKARANNLISEADAEQALAEAGGKIGEASVALKNGSASSKEYAAQLLERARFNFEGAKQFFDDEAFASAYSQSLAASAVAENALSELTNEVGDYTGELRNIKKYFDRISVSATQAGFSNAEYPKLFLAMSDVEGQIAKVSDLISSGSESAKIYQTLRKLKVAMSTLSQMLEGAIAAAADSRAAAVSSGAAASKDESGLIANIDINNGQFVPSVLRIKKGTVAAWINNDSSEHWIFSSALSALDSGHSLKSGETYSFLFKIDGSWRYFDRLNPAMVGVVVVE